MTLKFPKKINFKLKKRFLLLIIFCLTIACTEDENSSEEIVLMDVTHAVNFFTFTPDTGNNSSRLQYQITFTNPNNVSVKGFYRITTDADGLVATRLSTNLSPCYNLNANSDCTINFDAEDSFDLGRVNAIELISVEYNIDNQ